MTTARSFACDAFSKALLDPALAPPCGLPERRFAVYSNTVAVTLVDALAERFPVVRRLVGDAFFRAMAAAHVRRAPPSSPILAQYGAQFPAFIEGFEPARALPYLADMARLDFAVGLAYHAAEAAPMPLDAIAEALSAREDARLVLHPSAQLLSSRCPIVDIWRGHMADAPLDQIDLSQAQDALVIRCDADVETFALPAGGFCFMRALIRGARLAEAAAAGEAGASAFDPAACLSALFLARAVIAIV